MSSSIAERTGLSEHAHCLRGLLERRQRGTGFEFAAFDLQAQAVGDADLKRGRH
ncbi:MAG: hypothetical protein JO063_08015 [Pseudonocardiales bacterium]|nr:hypothetical protein [Pseudonocardiales bacterium]